MFKINYKNVSILFFLSTINYLLFDFIKKIKIIGKKVVYSILSGLKVNKKN